MNIANKLIPHTDLSVWRINFFRWASYLTWQRVVRDRGTLLSCHSPCAIAFRNETREMFLDISSVYFLSRVEFSKIQE